MAAWALHVCLQVQRSLHIACPQSGSCSFTIRFSFTKVHRVIIFLAKRVGIDHRSLGWYYQGRNGVEGERRYAGFRRSSRSGPLFCLSLWDSTSRCQIRVIQSFSREFSFCYLIRRSHSFISFQSFTLDILKSPRTTSMPCQHYFLRPACYTT